MFEYVMRPYLLHRGFTHPQLAEVHKQVGDRLLLYGVLFKGVVDIHVAIEIALPTTKMKLHRSARQKR